MLEEETFFFYLKHYSQQLLLSGYTHPSTCGKGDRPSHRQKLHQRCFSTLVVRDKEDKVKQKKKGGCFMTTDSLKSYESRRAANQSNTGWWFSHLYIYTLPVQMKNSCLHNWSQRCNSAAITEKKCIVHDVYTLCYNNMGCILKNMMNMLLLPAKRQQDWRWHVAKSCQLPGKQFK